MIESSLPRSRFIDDIAEVDDDDEDDELEVGGIGAGLVSLGSAYALFGHDVRQTLFPPSPASGGGPG